jgi:hypothetical protein
MAMMLTVDEVEDGKPKTIEVFYIRTFNYIFQRSRKMRFFGNCIGVPMFWRIFVAVVSGISVFQALKSFSGNNLWNSALTKDSES